jgi:tetrahydrodipicolinate N-succinyltransferase
VQVGEGSFIGSGSVLRQGLAVGSGCVIGMGCHLLKSLPDNTLFTGKEN